MRGRGMWGGAEPDLTARPGSGPRTLRQIAAIRRLPEWMRILSRLVKNDEA